MLVLSRKNSERIHIGDKIVVTLIQAKDGKARIGIQAPADICVDREEIFELKTKEFNKVA